MSDPWVNGVFSKLLKVKTGVEGIAYVIQLNISQFFSSLNRPDQFLNGSKFSFESQTPDEGFTQDISENLPGTVRVFCFYFVHFSED